MHGIPDNWLHAPPAIYPLPEAEAVENYKPQLATKWKQTGGPKKPAYRATNLKVSHTSVAAALPVELRTTVLQQSKRLTPTFVGKVICASLVDFRNCRSDILADLGRSNGARSPVDSEKHSIA